MFNISNSAALYARTMEWKSDGDYEEGTDMSTSPQMVYIWESMLQELYLEERFALLTICCIIFIGAVVGNVFTLYVVIARNQRLLFKVCLLSLAASDLLFVISSGSSYLSRLVQKNSLLWILGSFGCTTIPFVQTASVIIGSFSLVAIALDRYLAVLNKSQMSFLQSKTFCYTSLLIVWLIGCSISSPMLFSYYISEIYVVPDFHPTDYFSAYFCVTNMDNAANYYIILFTFIFAPIFVAFVWLNTIIAREIWKRRHAPGTRSQSKSKRTDEDSSTAEFKATDETNTSSNVRNHSSKISTGESKNSAVSSKAVIFTVQAPPPPTTEQHRNDRQRRQMRMFKVIMCLMSVFIMCRLPNWIFVLYKLNNEVTGRFNWLLYYGFGLTGLLNCMLNPLLYTFLSETIRISKRIGGACFKLCKPCRRAKKPASHYANNQTMFASASIRRKSDGGIYLGS